MFCAQQSRILLLHDTKKKLNDPKKGHLYAGIIKNKDFISDTTKKTVK